VQFRRVDTRNQRRLCYWIGLTVISDVGECDGSLEGVTVVGLTVEGLAVGLVDG